MARPRPAPKRPAAKAKPAKPVKAAMAAPAKAAKAAKTAKAAPAKPARPATAKATKTAKAKTKPAKTEPAKPAARSTSSAPTKPATTTAASPPAPAPARFTFTAVPIVRDAAGLTPLLREQLVVDARLRAGRVTTPDRIPTNYFSPGVVRWRVAERGRPTLDVVHDTAFFPDSAEPVGLERIAGVWQATGRGSERGRALDLPRLAWELLRDWPGRRMPLPPEPKAGARVKPLPPEPEAPWPDGTTFV